MSAIPPELAAKIQKRARELAANLGISVTEVLRRAVALAEVSMLAKVRRQRELEARPNAPVICVRCRGEAADGAHVCPKEPTP